MDFEGLLDSVYAAAADQSQWEVALEGVREFFGAETAHLEFGHKHEGLKLFEGVGVRGVEDYVAHYRSVCPRFELTATSKEGEITHDYMLGNERALDGYEFYSDFLRNQGLRYHAASLLTRDAVHQGVIVVQRSPKAGALFKEEIEQLRRLVPHFQRALALTRELSERECHLRDYRESLLHSSAAAIVDGEGRVHFANQKALAILKMTSVIRVNKGILEATGARERYRLAAYLSRIASTHEAQKPLCLGRGRDIIRLEASRLPSPERFAHFASPSDAGRILLSLRNNQGTGVASAAELEGIAGMPPAEAKLAAALLAGSNVQEYAAESGLSVQTVRTYMRQLRQRLECRSQAEVVATLVRLTTH